MASKSLLYAYALALALVTSTAHASEPTAQEKETARALLDQGDERFEAKNYDGALEAYQGAHAIMRVPTTAIEVAKAHEALGHLVEARDALLEAVRYPKTGSEPAAYTIAREDAAKHASELAARIPSVSLQIEGLPPGHEAHVKVDTFAVPPAAARSPIKVNAGHHVLYVTSDVTEDAFKEVDVHEGENITTSLDVVLLPPDKLPQPRKAHSRSVIGTVGLAAAGAGAAAMAVGGIFGFRASAKQDEAGCPNNVCPDTASATTLREANDWADRSTIVVLSGAAAAAIGITLWLVFSDDKSTASRTVHYARAAAGHLEF